MTKRRSAKQASARRAPAASEQETPETQSETPSARRKRTALPAEAPRTFAPAPMLSPTRPTSAHPGTERGVMDPDADWANGAESDTEAGDESAQTSTSDEE